MRNEVRNENFESIQSESDMTPRYPCRIQVRMTPEERRAIGQRASRRDLSISRYLVQLAVDGRSQSPQDKARLNYLATLFQEASQKMQSLLRTLEEQKGTGETALMAGSLQESAHLLDALTEELKKRLQ